MRSAPVPARDLESTIDVFLREHVQHKSREACLPDASLATSLQKLLVLVATAARIYLYLVITSHRNL
jgi:hypothetical protein